MQVQAFSANGSTPKPMEIAGSAQPPISGFSMLMTAALVALIGVTAFGVFRGSLDFLPGHTGPEPTMAAGLAYSPVASPEAAGSCQTDSWVNIFDGTVPDVDGLLPAVVLADDGTLTLQCETGSEMIASGVRDVDSLYWPGAIALVMDDETVRLLNLVTDRSIELDGAPLLANDGSIDYQHAVYNSGAIELWLVTPANTDHTDWRIVDLRSMESILLSEDLGGPLPEAWTPSFGQMTGTDVSLVAWYPEGRYQAATPVPHGEGDMPSLDHAALVLPGSLEARRWVEAALGADQRRPGFARRSHSPSARTARSSRMRAPTARENS